MTSSSNDTTARVEYFIQQLNSSNAKKIALLMVFGFIFYHGLLHWRYGSDSCKWLLSNGRFKGDREWQPYGCMMHKYSQMDTKRCFRYLAFWDNHNHFVFIGDIRVQLLYQSFLAHLQQNNNEHDILNTTAIANKKDAEHFLEFVDYKLRLRINYIYAPNVSESLINQFNKWKIDDDPPSAIIASCMDVRLSNISDITLKQYAMNLTRLVEPITTLIERKTKVLWKLQDSVDEDKLTGDWKNLHNKDIDKINQIVSTVFSRTRVQIWSSSKRIAAGLMDETANGWQLSRQALQHDVQILFNMYCNDYMNYNDGSCCSSAEPYTILQVVTYAILAICVLLSSVIIIRQWIMRLNGHTFYMPLPTDNISTTVPNPIDDRISPIFALSTLGIIMAYFYLCDRTNFFMKENKYYSEFSFWLPVGYLLALGLFFTEDSRFTKVLHRDQTDELKGWMQLVLLVCHMTGADRVVAIHMYIKVIISAYLFLSGYGHFTYVWHTSNTGLSRFLQVLFRLNFITIVLCLCMNRPYQFYYFVPLISFWFIVIYFVLSLPPHITSFNIELNTYQYLYLVLKFVCLLSVITILYMSEVFFERIFVTRPWKALFVTTDDDIHEWWYRWKLDRYTITFGMIFAFVFQVAQKYNIIDDNNHGNLFSRRVSLLTTSIAIVGVGAYIIFALLCNNKQDCEEIHSYIVFIPIISYIVLRNISGILRIRFSTFFAWFGRISLELFICQYHIWLAADRHGVLVLIPGFPNLNLLITSFIFVCASHEMHRLTQVLLPYVVPNDWKLALRNFVIFLVVLIPIARYDGMF